MTVNNFKQNNADYGSYKLYDGKGKSEKMVGVGTFNFNAHWTPTKVHADLICGTDQCKTGTIEITNKWLRTGSSSYTPSVTATRLPACASPSASTNA